MGGIISKGRKLVRGGYSVRIFAENLVEEGKTEKDNDHGFHGLARIRMLYFPSVRIREIRGLISGSMTNSHRWCEICDKGDATENQGTGPQPHHSGSEAIESTTERSIEASIGK
jgi:hypothetical protein